MKHLICIFFFIPFHRFAGATQESTLIEALNLHNNLHQTSDLDLAVSVSDIKTINEISSSIMKAEAWLKTHVLSSYPSTKITTIVVFFPDSCQTTQDKPIFVPVLSSLKNLYHSLTRWGLEKYIKVSSGFSYQCLTNPENTQMKAVLIFLKTINSTFTINPPLNHNKHLDLLYSVEKFTSLNFNKVNFLNPTKEATLMMTRRSLTSLVNKVVPEILKTVIYNEKLGPALPPENPPLSSPELSPCVLPGQFPSPSPSPVNRKNVEGLWCVAKPSVAAETLQQSLDFACGEGGANCDEIKPHGICFYPDTTMAHASYAFNIYWQKTKRNGGTCSFGGTAMLITTDPSYRHCRFLLI